MNLKAKVSIPLATIIGIAAYAGTYWLDAEYVSKASAEAFLDPLYIRQDSYRESQIDNRIYELRDDIQAVMDRGYEGNRELTSWEKAKIDRLRNQILELGGAP